MIRKSSFLIVFCYVLRRVDPSVGPNSAQPETGQRTQLVALLLPQERGAKHSPAEGAPCWIPGMLIQNMLTIKRNKTHVAEHLMRIINSSLFHFSVNRMLRNHGFPLLFLTNCKILLTADPSLLLFGNCIVSKEKMDIDSSIVLDVDLELGF